MEILRIVLLREFDYLPLRDFVCGADMPVPRDEVFGVRAGCLAEYVCVRADRGAVVSKPANVNFEDELMRYFDWKYFELQAGDEWG